MKQDFLEALKVSKEITLDDWNNRNILIKFMEKIFNPYREKMIEQCGAVFFLFGNKALTYVSTEGEPAIKEYASDSAGQVKRKQKKTRKRG